MNVFPHARIRLTHTPFMLKVVQLSPDWLNCQRAALDTCVHRGAYRYLALLVLAVSYVLAMCEVGCLRLYVPPSTRGEQPFKNSKPFLMTSARVLSIAGLNVRKE